MDEEEEEVKSERGETTLVIYSETPNYKSHVRDICEHTLTECLINLLKITAYIYILSFICYEHTLFTLKYNSTMVCWTGHW